MEIIEKQYLSVESLLSYRTRSTYSKLDKLIEHISESLKFLDRKYHFFSERKYLWNG